MRLLFRSTNTLVQLATALREITRLYQLPNLVISPKAEEFYQHIPRFQQQCIDLGNSSSLNPHPDLRLDYITKSFRHIHDHILLIEHPLVREEFTSIEKDLEKASTAMSWAIETDATDFLHRLRRTLSDFEERLFKSKANIDEMKMLLKRFMKTPLYARSETRQDPLLIVHEKENRVSKRNQELNDVSLRLEEILKVGRPMWRCSERRVLSLCSKTNGCSKRMPSRILGKPTWTMSMK